MLHRAILFLVLLVQLSTGTPSYPGSTDFETYAVLTCDGDLMLLPDHPLGVRVSLANALPLYEGFVNRLYERLTCACPGLTRDDFNRNRAYFAPEFWLNTITAKNNHTSCYQWRGGYPGNLLELQQLFWQTDFQVDFTTCNYTSWNSPQGCMFQLYVSSLNLHLQVAAKKCSPTQYVPYISVTCKGELCARYMMPCNTQADCEATRCHALGYYRDSLPGVALEDLLETLKISYILDDQDGDNTQLAVDFYSRLLNMGREYVYGFTKSKLQLQSPGGMVNFPVCSPSWETQYDDWTSMCEGDIDGVVTCPAWTSWDGMLQDGSSAFDPSRTSGSRWLGAGKKWAPQPVVPISDGIVLVDYTCMGQLSFLPDLYGYGVPLFPGFPVFSKLYGISEFDPLWLSALSGQSLTFNMPFHDMFEIAQDWFRNYQQQRAEKRGGILSNIAFGLTWSYEQFLYDWVQAPSKPPVDHGPTMSSLRTFLIDLLGSPFYQVSLPGASCTYDRWTNEHVCSGDYTGWSEFFGVDATLRVSVKNCSNSYPSVQVQCIGTSCAPIFGTPIRCSSNSQCARGLVCAPLNEANYAKYNYDALYDAAVISGNPEAAPYAGDKCAGASYYQKDMDFFLNNLLGAKGTGVGVCQVNWTNLVYVQDDGWYPYLRATQHVVDWLQGAGEVVGRMINLAYFKDWFQG